MRKRYAAVLLLCLLCLSWVLPSAAATTFGRLTIVDVASPVCLYYAADAGGNLSEMFVQAPLGNILDEHNAVRNAASLWEYAKSQELYDQIEVPDNNGQIRFDGLEIGIYLVASETEDFLPFLIQIPLRVDGVLTYDVEAKPKQGGSDPTIPSRPTDPGAPGTGIPQTGTSVIPMYGLLILGTLLTLVGLYEVVRGRKEQYD